MLAERISAIFIALGCNNSDIARLAECSPSHISRLRSGKRNPPPNSPSIMLLAEGVYSYADKYNELDVLCELCQSNDAARNFLIPKIIGWLFNNETDVKSISIKPPAKSEKRMISLLFGDRLNAIMKVLNLSNSRLARQLNVDDSHVSRFRNGLRMPAENSGLQIPLSEALYERAVEVDKLSELAAITKIDATILSADEGINYFTQWLFSKEIKADVSGIKVFLEKIDNFDIGAQSVNSQCLSTYDIPFDVTDKYRGLNGLQNAVVRFLTCSVNEKANELCLYSDQSMEWLTDVSFFRKWQALMIKCTNNHTKIKIVHNVERDTNEMLAAISSWLPLYMSGMIEPYVCRQKGDMRFSHTLFLYPDKACIIGSHVRNTENEGYYYYLTESDTLYNCSVQYNAILAQSEPLVRMFFDSDEYLLHNNAVNLDKDSCSLLSSLSIETMPEILLTKILDRSSLTDNERANVLRFYKQKRQALLKALVENKVCEILPVAADEALFSCKIKVNLGTALIEKAIFYTPDEYSEHVKEILRLLNEYANYQLYLLPETPFSDIQIVQQGQHITVLKQSKPNAAFVFENPYMSHAFDDYFTLLKNKYKSDRNEIRQTLKKYL